MKSRPKIFVIIVTYKGKRWYDKCFSSLRESTIPVQTIVVDNSPGDEDAKYITERFPDVYLIKTNENLGFGRANNLGMRYALDHGCDYVFLLNQDTWIEEDSIEKLVRVAENHPEYGIISPIHLTSDKKSLNLMYEYSNHSFSHNLLSDLYCGMPLKDIYQTDYVNAAAWLLPRKTLEMIGGFCPLFMQYGEDDDYLNRVRYHGFKVGVVPSSQIVHDDRIRLENSKILYEQANIENVDVFLNINNKTSLRKWRFNLLKIWIRGVLFHDKNRDLYKAQYIFFCSKQRAIKECRDAHKKKQANWL